MSSPLPKKSQPMLMADSAFQHKLDAGQTLKKPKARCPSAVYQSHPFCLWFCLTLLGSHSLWNLKPSVRLQLRWLGKDVSGTALSPHTHPLYSISVPIHFILAYGYVGKPAGSLVAPIAESSCLLYVEPIWASQCFVLQGY